VLVLCLGLSLAGCGDGGTPITPGGANAQDTTRIVSLSPILTQMVVDLGLAKSLVAVTEHDDAAPAGVATVGSAETPNLEKIRQLNPSHILMLFGPEGAPQEVKDLATTQGAWLAAYPRPRRVNDLAPILHDDLELIVKQIGALDDDDDIDASDDDAPVARPKSLGFVFDRQKRASDLRLEMMLKLRAIHRVTNNHLRRVEREMLLKRQELLRERQEMLAAIDLIDDPDEREAERKRVPEIPPLPVLRPAVLLVTEADPLTVVGPDRVLDDLLGYVGASNAASETKEAAPTFDREKLLRYLNPQLPTPRRNAVDPITGLPLPDAPLSADPLRIDPLNSNPAAPPSPSDPAVVGVAAAALEMPVRLMPPDVIVFLEPHGPKLESPESDSRLRVFRGVDVPAMREGRFVVIDDVLAQVPSTSLVRVATVLAKSIHPQLADQIDRALEKAMDVEDDGSDDEVEALLRQPLPGTGAPPKLPVDSLPRFAPPPEDDEAPATPRP
jgi:ABC-type Fe3+-hydroxamate transport system substrate-binding protein